MAKADKTSYPKEKIRILFLENISDAAVKNFRQYGYVQVDKITKALSEDELIEEIKNVHILGIRSKTQITKKILDGLNKEIILMHPGPINRGVELSSDAADSGHSIILDQVENGVAIRMAVMYLLAGATT